MQKAKKAILFLEDGLFFIGEAVGTPGETGGEICFNTGHTGYQEILTDPSYAQQIITFTSPHIGNCGVNSEDMESDHIFASGVVIKEVSLNPSNWRSESILDAFLKGQGITGIKRIDTRALTVHIRDRGAMNALISTEDFDLESLARKSREVPSMEGQDLARSVTVGSARTVPVKGKSRFRVAAIDFGGKANIYRMMSARGLRVTIFPAHVSPDEILAIDPDGIFLSNGPGDPAAVTYAIETVKKLLGTKPMFGICLGHQILALALGAKTFKLKFGHRGINHPVRDLQTGKIEITSQNHGFAVSDNNLPAIVEVTHRNLNDNTIAGISCVNMPAYSVQYHPEASPGPHDSHYIFDHFITMMESHAKTQ